MVIQKSLLVWPTHSMPLRRTVAAARVLYGLTPDGAALRGGSGSPAAEGWRWTGSRLRAAAWCGSLALTISATILRSPLSRNDGSASSRWGWDKRCQRP